MTLLPLALTAHPSAWCAGQDERQSSFAGGTGPCRFCGWSAPGWFEPFHLNGDHSDDAPANVVAACVLCHLTQHLDEIEADREASLIWLPEMSQAALISLARRIHLEFAWNDESPSLNNRPRRYDPRIAAAYRAHCALLDRKATLEARVGTSAPSDFGAALLQLGISRSCERSPLLGGVRLLPRGQVIRNGVDIYPDLLAAAPRPRKAG